MGFRYLRMAAALAALIGIIAVAETSRAETMAVGAGLAVKESALATPARGMSMDQVASKFGPPASKLPAVGKPPISRWDYSGFVVYFERERVIHSVVANS